MPEAVTQLGVGGVFVILVLQMIFKFLKQRRNSTPVVKLSPPFEEAFRDMSKKVGEMHDLKPDIKKSIDKVAGLYRMHNVTDEDGRPIWYSHKSLEKAVTKLADILETQGAVMIRIAERLDQNEKDHARMETKIEQLMQKGG